MANFNQQLIAQIETGCFAEASATVELLSSLAGDPSVCSQETLEALRQARTLAIVQRSHLQRRLRSLQASRLFHAPSSAGLNTWEIDA